MRIVSSSLSGDAGLDQFFFAPLGGIEQLRQEVFALGYHLSWSHTEIMGLDIAERRAYLRLLSEQIERENQVMQRAASSRAR